MYGAQTLQMCKQEEQRNSLSKQVHAVSRARHMYVSELLSI